MLNSVIPLHCYDVIKIRIMYFSCPKESHLVIVKVLKFLMICCSTTKVKILVLS